MALKDEIRTSMISATKSRDLVALSTLRMLLASIQNREIDRRGEIDDSEVLRIVSTLIKQRKEAIDLYRKGSREDLAEKESAEIVILEKYLPKQMGREEIIGEITSVLGETGASGMKDMGKVMKVLMPRVTGKADGKEVSDLVKDILEKS